MSRMFLFELQVDTLNTFYDHNENRELQVYLFRRGWFCNLFFWVKVKPLLNSKVWFDSAPYPQAWPLPNPQVPKLLDGTQLTHAL